MHSPLWEPRKMAQTHDSKDLKGPCRARVTQDTLGAGFIAGIALRGCYDHCRDD
jgi:hypothetical protein